VQAVVESDVRLSLAAHEVVRLEIRIAVLLREIEAGGLALGSVLNKGLERREGS
jgi:hypothetical protein